ncbi:MAG: Smr/MutS family protein [Myxococcales bacterium]|nr:Smr/MutS family protein [Myxococcales bacterium]
MSAAAVAAAAAAAAPDQAPQRARPPRDVEAENDPALFARAVADARPLQGRDNFIGQRRPPPSPRLVVDDDAEVVAELDALVSGSAHFDLSWSDEHIEGIAHGVDRRLLRKLRRGDYSWRRHLDLHGLTRKEAKPEVAAFLDKARADGQRCVLVVHGRGLNSKDRIPVLKEALAVWLTRGRIGQLVLAFSSARPSDGGLGAVYVLLRR